MLAATGARRRHDEHRSVGSAGVLAVCPYILTWGVPVQDPVAAARRKARLVVELQYPIIPDLIDSRGHIAATLHPSIKDRFPHFGIGDAHVIFTDKEPGQPATEELLISAKRMSYIQENPGPLGEFRDVALKHLKLAYEALPTLPPSIARIGVRFLTVEGRPGAQNYEEVRRAVLDKLHKMPFDLPLEYRDSIYGLIHKNGQFVVMPAKKQDEWIRKNFMDQGSRIPDVGYAFDIDSSQADLQINEWKDVVVGIDAVLDLSRGIELALARALDLIDG